MSSCISLEKPIKIAFLGPEFTYTHQAAGKKFGSSVEYVACVNISDVFTEVERGRCDYGVVPVENSTEGAVNYTLDMFIESDLKICAEMYLAINHNFISNAKNIKSVERIYSHPQAFAQCRVWIETNTPHAKLIHTSSTAEAARFVSEHGHQKDEIACIAGLSAAEHYDLQVKAPSIEDVGGNTTRFIVISKNASRPTASDRTSLVFSIKDRVGALHDILLPFQKAKINLTKIESRPSKKQAWSYFFFVDFEGHVENAKVLNTLKALEKKCSFFKVLGSYPKANY